MMTLPGGWKDLGARPAAAAAGQDESAPVSVQRCLSVNGAQRPVHERRAARTQLGMPALWIPDEPATSERRAADVGKGTTIASPARTRRTPPPLPARFATPKVMLAAAPLLPNTIPARRLLLQDATCELDAADLLPLRELPPPAAARGVAGTSAARRFARQPRGVRGLLASVLVRLLSLVAPSLHVQSARRPEGR